MTTATRLPDKPWTLRGKKFEFRCVQQKVEVPEPLKQLRAPAPDPSTRYGEGELFLPDVEAHAVFVAGEFDLQDYMPVVGRAKATQVQKVTYRKDCVVSFETLGEFHRTDRP